MNVAMSKNNFIVRYDLSALNEEERKDDLLLLANILLTVETIDEFNTNIERREIKAVYTGYDFW